MFRVMLIALMMAAPAAAQNVTFGGMRADTSAPVEVTADNLTVTQSDNNALFSGNVVIGQGDMRLSADQVTVQYGAGGQNRIASLTARGNVVLVSGDDAAEAQQADYDVDGGTVTLIGDVTLVQGQNVLAGDRMVVDLATGAAQVQGRVRSILQPGGN
ncbi:lipopolysaccharide transport periplasmic protein LptA [Paracoccus sp. (in: a-proteobacteria)]|uniref:lipopolysaccharide transport periplasmic protein LptA n=1 Tax=Paracoccus sp. TaxID=267 RepID=UPI0026E08FC7|nr:lipopolysaccharide transport periplasmic protein LptA [Paracoccus sp. (in: a-proteobacteria)]MDO5647014.1 lipopolysaccharide transport periplasmic protein LptA [Paracoccus sp. (in: a-proteobacteria)]